MLVLYISLLQAFLAHDLNISLCHADISVVNNMKACDGRRDRLLNIMLAFFEHFGEAKALSIVRAF